MDLLHPESNHEQHPCNGQVEGALSVPGPNMVGKDVPSISIACSIWSDANDNFSTVQSLKLWAFAIFAYRPSFCIPKSLLVSRVQVEVASWATIPPGE